MIQETRYIAFLRHPYEGNASEQGIAELAGYPVPVGSWLDQAQGFQGVLLPGMLSGQPKKKPRGGELTPPEQAMHRQISSIGMWIEHAFGGVKRSKIVKDTLPSLKDGIRDVVMETCCG